MKVVLHHPIGIQTVAGTPLPLGCEARPHVHSGSVQPHEKRLVVVVGVVDEFQCCVRKFFVCGLHPLARERPGILNLAICIGVNDATRCVTLVEGRILWIKVCFRLLLGIKVIEIAEKLVKAMVSRQEFILISEVVLSKLPGCITMGLKQFGDRRVLRLQANICARQSHFQETGAQGMLACNKGRPACRATLLAIVIREHGTTFGNSIDIGRPTAQHTAVIGAYIGPAYIITPYHQDIGLLAGRARGSRERRQA